MHGVPGVVLELDDAWGVTVRGYDGLASSAMTRHNTPHWTHLLSKLAGERPVSNRQVNPHNSFELSSQGSSEAFFYRASLVCSSETLGCHKIYLAVIILLSEPEISKSNNQYKIYSNR
jgi:hypothetical protein